MSFSGSSSSSSSSGSGSSGGGEWSNKISWYPNAQFRYGGLVLKIPDSGREYPENPTQI